MLVQLCCKAAFFPAGLLWLQEQRQETTFWVHRPLPTNNFISMHKNGLGEARCSPPQQRTAPLPTLFASVAEKLPKLNRTNARGRLLQVVEKRLANPKKEKAKPRTYAYKRPGRLNCSSLCLCASHGRSSSTPEGSHTRRIEL